MRDVLVALFVLASLPTCFRRPFIGLLMFTLLAYMRVQDLTWGWARYERWSYYVALATAIGFVLSSGKKRFMLPDLRNWAMVALIVLVGASLLASSWLSKRDFANFVEYVKIVGVALFTTGIVKNRASLRILVYVIALSFGFYGVKNGLAFILSGGGLKIIDGPGGMLTDNNDFALALCMGTPLILHLGLSERRPLLRRVMLCIVPGMLMTIVATHSRGAFLAITLTFVVLVWRSRNRVAGFALFALIAIAGALAAPKSYYDRISTLKTYQEDGSAVGRLEAWKVAGRMIAARPMLGVGYSKFQQNYKNYDHNPTVTASGETDAEGTRVAHNSYLQIWAECGTPAFLLYLYLIAASFIDLWAVRREALKRYYSSWILSYATMFEASLVAFTIGSFFLNRAQFDLFYHFVAVVIVFGKLAREAMADPLAHPEHASAGGPLVQVRTPGFGARERRSGFDRPREAGGFDALPRAR